MECKQFGIGMDVVVETDLFPEDFNEKFKTWVESNGWKCKGATFAVEEEGSRCSLRRDL